MMGVKLQSRPLIQLAMATATSVQLTAWSPTSSHRIEPVKDVGMRRMCDRGHKLHEHWYTGSTPILTHSKVKLHDPHALSCRLWNRQGSDFLVSYRRAFLALNRALCGFDDQIRVRARVRDRDSEGFRVPVKAQYGDKKKGVVITGGSKGLGFSLAREFLAEHANVVICGRNEDQLNAALSSLQTEFGEESGIHGVRCDVSSASDVAALASFAKESLGTIHFWINNAGEVTSKKLLADVDAEEIMRVSNTNVVGSLLCCREAVRLMRLQERASEPIYHIFNMGFSKWGASFTKSACTHKSTKVALTQLTRSLSEELQAAGLRSIGVHNLSPGMVLTDLLLKDSTPVARRFFNTLAEEPETVAKDLVPRILATRGTAQSIECLSPASAFFKVAFGFPQIISGGRFFDKEGNRVGVGGERYQENGVKLM